MKKTSIAILLFITAIGIFLSCKKYKDSKPVTDPRLNKHYCNDPNAVNFNWDFPGIPDNSVCFYPTDVFQGVYEFHDSVFLKTSGLYIHADTVVITIHKLSNTKFSMLGFCPSGDSLIFTAGASFTGTADTTVGDTLTNRGQLFCSVADTINGSITKDRIDTGGLLTFYFQVYSDTGVTTLHIGTARYKK
jgi:hypothetical protein